jgi:hypothetical protein
VTEPDVLSAISASAKRWWKRLHGCTKPPKINSLTTPAISGSLSNLRHVLREGFVIRTPGAFRSLSITGRRNVFRRVFCRASRDASAQEGRPSLRGQRCIDMQTAGASTQAPAAPSTRTGTRRWLRAGRVPRHPLCGVMPKTPC